MPKYVNQYGPSVVCMWWHADLAQSKVPAVMLQSHMATCMDSSCTARHPWERDKSTVTHQARGFPTLGLYAWHCIDRKGLSPCTRFAKAGSEHACSLSVPETLMQLGHGSANKCASSGPVWSPSICCAPASSCASASTQYGLAFCLSLTCGAHRT